MLLKKKLSIIISLTLIILLALAVIIYYFGATYSYYDSIKKDEFAIPGLDTSFVPQGLSYDENSNNFFVGGYMSDGSKSRIYCLAEDNNFEPKYITLLKDDKDFCGHLGGVAVYQNNLFIASDGLVLRANLSDITSATDGSEIAIIDYFTTGNGADSVTVYNDKLYVGEFFKANKYETKPEHHITINEKETNKAIAYCYTLDSSKPYGVSSTTPIYGISVPNQVQGFDFTADGNIVVSTSYSIPDSKILIYSNVFDVSNKTNISLFDKSFDVYILASNNLKKEITAPAMSEELIIKDNRAYILFESACSKYRFVNRTRTTNVHSITID